MKRRFLQAVTVASLLAFCGTMLLWMSSAKFSDSFSGGCGPLAVCVDSEAGEMRLRWTVEWSGGLLGPTVRHGPPSSPLASIFRWQANSYRGFGYDSAVMVDGLSPVLAARRWHLVVAPHWAVLGGLAIPLFYSVEVSRRRRGSRTGTAAPTAHA